MELNPRLGDVSAGKRGVRQLQDLVVILVAEDDPIIQALVEGALIQAGLEPAIVALGEKAVTLIEGNRSHYRVLVTDINLRGELGGWEVAKQAREIDPAFPIVYMTGNRRRRMGLARRPQQRPFDQTVCTRSACHRHCPTPQ
jgi:CheY-like chemotaxis protein